MRVAAVPPVEQRAADQDRRGEMNPEAVRPLLGGVDPRADREVEEPGEERHDRRPVAAARDQVDHEEGPGRGHDQHDQREAVDRQRRHRREEHEQHEREQAEVEALERRVAVEGRQPAEPLPHRGDERGEREHRREPEDPAGEPEAPSPEPQRDRLQHDEDEQRPAHVAEVAVVVREVRKSGQRGAEHGQPAEVDQEGRRRPDRLEHAHCPGTMAPGSDGAATSRAVRAARTGRARRWRCRPSARRARRRLVRAPPRR